MNRCLTSARRCAALIFLPVLLALGCPAQAATIVLAPGEEGVPPRVDLDILKILNDQTVAFGTGSLTGFVRDRVLQLTNGKLAFETMVMADSAPPPGIFTITRTNFAGFPTVEVGWEDIDITRSFIPDFVKRSAGSGSTITFEFNLDPITQHPDGIPLAQWASNPVVVITDATDFANIGSFQAFGTNVISTPVNVFSPVPEPQTLAMLALGLCFAVGIGRRRGAR